jgi:hypothetical protein
VTDKRDRIITDPGLGPMELPGPSTLRSIESADDWSSISPNAPVYYQPAPLVAVSDHRTLELETVKLSEDIDPRKLVTELRLDKVPSVIPPSDSGWPPQTALSSSQPPLGPARRWRAPAVLLAILGALLLLVLARAATRRHGAAAELVGTSQAVIAGPPVAVVRAPAAAVQKPAAALAITAVVAPPVASAALSAVRDGMPGAASVPVPSAVPIARSESASARTLSAPTHSVKTNPQPRAPLVAPSSSKPKRAIY